MSKAYVIHQVLKRRGLYHWFVRDLGLLVRSGTASDKAAALRRARIAQQENALFAGG